MALPSKRNAHESDKQKQLNAIIDYLNGVPAVRVYNSANLSIGTASPTILTFNSERFDTDSCHSVASNTERLTCNTAGIYLITGHVAFAANATGQRWAYFLFNAVTPIASHCEDASAVDETDLSLATIYQLAVGNYVTLAVEQSSGGDLNVLAATNYSPEFGMVRIA